MAELLAALAAGVLTSDGAMGTMLQERGLTDGGAPELWNVDHADVVEGILEEGFDSLDAFLSHMWAVTVIGAPKKAAAQTSPARARETVRGSAATACARWREVPKALRASAAGSASCEGSGEQR